MISTVCAIAVLVAIVSSGSEAAVERPGQTRILGGKNADPSTFNYFVRLEILVSDTAMASCGGSLIRLEEKEVTESNLILTAAHCVTGATDGSLHDAAKVTILAGGEKKSLAQMTDKVKVKAILRHPQYDTKTIANDIALLVLDKPLKVSKTVSTIRLPTAAKSAFDRCQIMGYGLMSDDKTGKDTPAVLQFGSTSIQPDDVCIKKYGSAKFSPEKNVCIGTIDKAAGNAVTCQGDSGGPLACKTKDNQEYLVGATSFGGALCSTGNSVFTFTTPYVAWIKGEVAKLGKSG